MEHVPSFTGATQLGCQAQLIRARGPPQSIAEVLQADLLALNDEPIDTHMLPIVYSGCGCRISENGCIDPSECRISHPLFRIPILSRWCDQTTCRLRGGGALLLWSGWARPSVMKILGRFPTVDQALWLISRSHPRTLHVRWRYQYIPRHDEELNSTVIDLFSNQHNGERANKHLRTLNPASRFGQHGLPTSI
jgi:hypothetical protein